jgi:hypothetical protein
MPGKGVVGRCCRCGAAVDASTRAVEHDGRGGYFHTAKRRPLWAVASVPCGGPIAEAQRNWGAEPVTALLTKEDRPRIRKPGEPRGDCDDCEGTGQWMESLMDAGVGCPTCEGTGSKIPDARSGSP